jgi:hypothetical protein
VKVVPIVAGAAALVATGAHRDRSRLTRAAAGAAVGLAVGLGPMLALSFDSVRTMLGYHAARGLHVESSLGVLYGALAAVVSGRQPGVLDFGSYNFHGGVADALAKGSSLLTLALAGVATFAAHRASGGRDGDDDRLGRAALAALSATVALWLGGKVFSPQYLTWALPLVIAVPGASWKKLSVALGVGLVLTQLYYRGFYDHVYEQRPLGILTLLVRLAALGVLFAVSLAHLRRVERAP